MSRNGSFANFLGRDNVLVNLDKEGYDAYLRGREERRLYKHKKEQINNLEEELKELKSNYSELKELLLQVLEKNK